MMKMNGMKAWAYYLAQYVTFYLLFLVSTAVFLIVGRVTQLDMFSKTAPGLLVTIFLVWGAALNSLAFFFASFFNKSRLAFGEIFPYFHVPQHNILKFKWFPSKCLLDCSMRCHHCSHNRPNLWRKRSPCSLLHLAALRILPHHDNH